MKFKVSVSCAQRVPPVKTAGQRTAKLIWNPKTHVVNCHIAYSHMSSPVTGAHFHDAVKGKNGTVQIWPTKKGKRGQGSDHRQGDPDHFRGHAVGSG